MGGGRGCGEREKGGPTVTDSPPGPQSGPTLGTANLS